MVLYIQKYGMQTMNIMKQEKRASLPGGARRFAGIPFVYVPGASGVFRNRRSALRHGGTEECGHLYPE